MDIRYPDLYYAADEKAKKAQSLHFNLILAEYFLLIGTAILVWLADQYQIHRGILGLAFMSLIAIATISHFQKADSIWYNARALAESVKTTSWKFMMRADPFEGEADDACARSAFVDKLQSLLQGVDPSAFGGVQASQDGAQISAEMKSIRAKSVRERAEYYTEHRIQDQKNWYISKAITNQKLERNWYIIVSAIYVIPLVCVVFDKVDLSRHGSLISIVLLIGSGLLGWTKSKRYRELATSYSLTANEIGLVAELGSDSEDEESLSKFVTTGELAFSREHTQWIARQPSHNFKI